MMLVEAERPAVESDGGAVKAVRSPLELFAAATALLLPIAFVSGRSTDAWSLRSAILLVVVAVGIPMLLSQAMGPRPLAARAAGAFLLLGTASAALSQNHITAVFGLYDQGTGLLFMASLVSAWAIGRRLSPESRPLVERALILGILINVGIGLFASVVDVSSITPDLFADGGRLSGLAGNPVHLAALCVLALALMVPRFAAEPARWALPVAAVAAATQLSGTRGAILVMVAIGVWTIRRHGVRVGAVLALALLLGLGVATLVGSSTETSATGRAGGFSDWAARPATWLSARHSVSQHPLLGVGPGQFRTATSPYRPDSIGRLGAETLFTDAHNIFVEYATTTGLLGLGALLVWLWAAIRPGRGWLLVGALGVLAIHLFEPQSVITTPLAFLALGTAGSGGPERERTPRRPLRWLIHGVAIAGAVTIGAAFLFGEFQLNHASQLDSGAAPADRANGILPGWPVTASLLARVWLFHGITNHHNQADYRRSRTWLLVAVRRDDTDPALWNHLAEFDESESDIPSALIEYETALRLNPTSVGAMLGLARLARKRCDPGLEQHWRQRALSISPQAGRPPTTTPGRPEPVPPVCAGPANTGP